MLYRPQPDSRAFRHLLLRIASVFDGRRRRRRRTQMDLMSLSPYLQRDIGFPVDG
jgi:hypothetical protein